MNGKSAARPMVRAGEGTPASGQTYAQIPATLPCLSTLGEGWVVSGLPEARLAGPGHEVDAQKTPSTSSKGKVNPFLSFMKGPQSCSCLHCPKWEKVPVGSRGSSMGRSWGL